MHTTMSGILGIGHVQGITDDQFMKRPFHLIIKSLTGRYLSLISDAVYQNEMVFGSWMAGKFRLLGYDTLMSYGAERPEWFLGGTPGHLAVF